MKAIQKIILLTAIAMLIVVGANAQNSIKLGHINSDELMQSMPETDTAIKKLQSLQEEYQSTLDELQNKFNTSFSLYQENYATMSELVRSTKEQDLSDLRTRIDNFQVNAQQTFEQKQAEYLAPIREKAINAIKEIGDEHGFTYIFDVSPNSTPIVYMADNTEDILPLVKKKLGITD